jgi:hypothetical protein
MTQAKAQAKRDLARMEEKGYVLPKDDYAKEAIESVLTVMRLKDISPKDRLAAASKLLEYTLAKPAAETNVTLKKAEDFLADLAKDSDE